MKKIVLFIFSGLLRHALAAQRVVSFSGDLTDSTTVQKKRKLEALGFIVTVTPIAAPAPKILGYTTFINRYHNKPLLPFSLTDMNGVVVSSEGLKNKIVHINFWSVTCVPCIQ